MKAAELRAIVTAILYSGDLIATEIRNIERAKEGNDLLRADIGDSGEMARTLIHEAKADDT